MRHGLRHCIRIDGRYVVAIRYPAAWSALGPRDVPFEPGGYLVVSDALYPANGPLKVDGESADRLARGARRFAPQRNVAVEAA